MKFGYKPDYINKGLRALNTHTLALMLDEIIFYKRRGYTKELSKRLRDIVNFCKAEENK